MNAIDLLTNAIDLLLKAIDLLTNAINLHIKAIDLLLKAINLRINAIDLLADRVKRLGDASLAATAALLVDQCSG